MLSQTVADTLQVSQKEMGKSMDRFISQIEKFIKRMESAEKESDKRYDTFSNILHEAEVSMTKEQAFDKDFWIYEKNFIASANEQLKIHQEMTKTMLTIWSQCTKLDEERMSHTKELYSKVLETEKVMSPHVKQLSDIIAKTNSEEAASQVYGFRAFITREDLRGLHQLNELMGNNIDLEQCNTLQFMKFLESIDIENSPQTCFIKKEGFLQ